MRAAKILDGVVVKALYDEIATIATWNARMVDSEQWRAHTSHTHRGLDPAHVVPTLIGTLPSYASIASDGICRHGVVIPTLTRSVPSAANLQITPQETTRIHDGLAER